MSQKFAGDSVVPVTVVHAGPCTVTQVKGEKDGYRAIQLGFEKKGKVSKSLVGHFGDLGPFRYVREFRMEADARRGQLLTVAMFKPGDHVKVTGISKGRGFQGVVKRHHFAGSPKSHGHKDQLRMPGSIGSTEPKHVFKGTRMAGRMGGERVSVRNLEIVEVDAQNNLLYLKGAVPGARNSLLLISGEGDLVLIDREVMEAAPKEEQIATVDQKTTAAAEQTASGSTEITESKAESESKIDAKSNG